LSAAVRLPAREVRRSFVLNVVNGGLFDLAERLIDPPLVLTWFVSRLTASNLLIGLVAPLGDAGWYLPQIFVSARVQRMPRKMPSYAATAVVRALAWLLLAAVVWLVDEPLVLLVSFFTLYGVVRIVSGLSGLAFYDVTAKTIPPQQRGSLFAWRQLLGGLMGLGAGWIVKTVLNSAALPFPHGHAVLFALYCLAATPAMVAFIAIREPVGAAIEERVTVGQQLRRGGRLLRRDHVYRRFMAARLSLGLAGIALPFYAVYAKDILGAPEGMVGVYIAARVAAQLVCNLPWGWLGDRYGNRLALRLLAVGNGLTVLTALALVGLVSLLHPQGNWLPYLALPLFVLDGAVRPGHALAASNYLLEIVAEAERPLSVGLSNTLMGLIVLLSGLGGLLVDLSGFAGLFLTATALCLAAYVLATGLPEPRQVGRLR